MGLMAEEPLSIIVNCYAGYRGEETPRSFTLSGRRVEVVDVVDRWIAPDHRYFKVRGDDGAIYILRHDEILQKWELTMFDSGTHKNGRLSST